MPPYTKPSFDRPDSRSGCPHMFHFQHIADAALKGRSSTVNYFSETNFSTNSE